MCIKGIVFDFDGLVLDTESPVFQAWQEAFAPYGLALPISEWAAAIGSDLDSFDPVIYLEKTIGKSIDQDKIRKFQQQRSMELVSTQQVLPGVVEYLDKAVQMGLKIGMASSSDRPWVVGHLTRLGLIHYFEVVFTMEDVKRVKPSPDLYLRAAAGLDLEPNQTVAFEDAPNGILAAKRAGLFCVAVPNIVTRPLDFSGADFILDSFCQMPLDKTLDKINCVINNPDAENAR
jgi:HAD superfamily hydrolase (TIGR01509 family)